MTRTSLATAEPPDDRTRRALLSRFLWALNRSRSLCRWHASRAILASSPITEENPDEETTT